MRMVAACAADPGVFAPYIMMAAGTPMPGPKMSTGRAMRRQMAGMRRGCRRCSASRCAAPECANLHTQKGCRQCCRCVSRSEGQRARSRLLPGRGVGMRATEAQELLAGGCANEGQLMEGPLGCVPARGLTSQTARLPGRWCMRSCLQATGTGVSIKTDSSERGPWMPR